MTTIKLSGMFCTDGYLENVQLTTSCFSAANAEQACFDRVGNTELATLDVRTDVAYVIAVG